MANMDNLPITVLPVPFDADNRSQCFHGGLKLSTVEVLLDIENQCHTMTRSPIPRTWAGETHADKAVQ